MILLAAVLRWGLGQGRLPARIETEILLPIRHKALDLPPDHRREVVYADTHLDRLAITLARLVAEGRLQANAQRAIPLVAATAARVQEISRLVWREVDLPNRMLRLDPERHKAGRRTRRGKVIHLAAVAMAILSTQPRGKPDDLVFPSKTGPATPIALSKAMALVRREGKLPSSMLLHGFRHHIGSMLAMQGMSAVQIKQQLTHSSTRMSEAYVRFAGKMKQELAQTAETTTARLLPTVADITRERHKRKR